MSNKTKLQESVPVDYKFTAIIWATGSGKTGATFRLIDNKPGNWVFLTSEVINIKSIKEEAKARGYEHLLKRIKFYCYASLHKVAAFHKHDNIVLDEAQRVFTPLKLGQLAKLKPEQVIVSTATIQKPMINTLSSLFGFKDNEILIHKRTLKQNIDDDILPDPDINIYKIDLPDNSKDFVFKIKAGKGTTHLTGDISDRWTLQKQVKGKKGGYVIELACTAREYYDALSKEIEWASSMVWKAPTKQKEFFRLKAQRSGLERARFLAKIKEDKVLEIIEELKKKKRRFLAFAYSIESAEAFSDNTISSRNTTKVNEQLLDDFNSGKINDISSFKMLNAGVNLKNIQEVVFQHLEKSAFNFIQKTGRGMRAKKPVLHYVVVNDTVDKKNVDELTMLLQ